MGESASDAWTDEGAFLVAPGVWRVPLPLPGDGLKAVNVYVLEIGHELALVDAGWAIDVAEAQLEDALCKLDRDLGCVTTFLVTHLHRDHYELALKVRRRFGSRIALGIGERSSLETREAEKGIGKSPLFERLRASGASELVERLVETQREGDRGSIGWEPPDDWLRGGDQVALGNRTLEVVATPGHTQGHVVFIDRNSNLLFSGDHVLPHITPSIGFEDAVTDSALADYLASLALVRSLPDARLLPAHGPIRPTTHDRIDELLIHHEERLSQTEAAARNGAQTAHDVARVLSWTRRKTSFEALNLFNQILAVNETIAHLEVLVRRAALNTSLTDQGTRLYCHGGI